MCSSRQGISVGICKTKAIQADLGIIQSTHIFTYSGILRHIQAYSGPFVNLVYSEPWHTENQRHIQNPGISRTLGYLKPWYIQNPGIRGEAIRDISSKYCDYHFKIYPWVRNDGKPQKNWVAPTFRVANQGPKVGTFLAKG